jgi:hypothetical protein
MFKRIFFIFLTVIFVANIYAQRESDTVLFHRYSNIERPDNPQYFILKVAGNTPPEFLNKLILTSERRLSDNVFIITKEEQKELNFSGSFILKLEAANNDWKLSSSAQKATEGQNDKKNFRFFVQFKSIEALHDFLNNNSAFKQNVSIFKADKILSFDGNFNYAEKYLLNNPNVSAIDILTQKPKEELAITGFDLSTNQLNLVHARFPLFSGEGEHVSIKENDFDTADIDLKGRIDPSPLASKEITNHANFMATIIAGARNSVYYAKGAAPAARISSSSFESVLPDSDDYYLKNNITIQNHSYGTSIDNNYGLNAVAFDEIAHKNESLLHVFSSGNSGVDTSKSGTYANVPDFANITGNFKMAKNILVVGAVDSFGIAPPQSSAGPAYDGRIIPQIVAFQMNGTSESAALVSGTASLLQQYFKTKNNQDLPSALAKAILINSADDVGNPGPDFKTGFGNMNAMKAMDCIKENDILSGTITNGIADSFDLTIPENISLLKITLVWNDTTASTFSPKALVNDLDLQLISTSLNTVWKPWVLNTFPNADSLNNPAVRSRDSLNNEEQITLENPVAGRYKIDVKGYNVVTSNQKYFIAYSLDSAFYFNWQRPAGEDFAQKGMQTLLKWQSSFAGNGVLEYKFISGQNWQKIADVNISKSNFNWLVPDTVARVLLRMKINSNYYYSDTFLITTLLQPKTGFVCGDSVLIYWNKVNAIQDYRIYHLGEKYMEPYKTVSDTFAIILKNDLDNHFFAVAPVLADSTIGTKSYAFDYTLQGAGCFINSFYANLLDNKAHLILDLGTLHDVMSISFEKLNGNNYETISSSIVPQFENTFDFGPLKNGISFFRAKVILKNGSVIYSPIEPVTYVEPGKYLLLPVPVKKNEAINLYTTIPDNEIITVIDATGRIVLKKEIQFTHEYIQTSALQAGLYFYQITKKGLKVSSGKLIVL